MIALVALLAGCSAGADTAPAPVMLVRLIDFWQPVSGALTAGETQGWKFIGAAGERVQLRALSPAPDLTLTLQSAEGVTLATGAAIEAILPANGTFTVLVTSAIGGEYELGLGYADRPNPAAFTPTPLPVTIAVPTPTPPYYADLGTLIVSIRSGETLFGSLVAPDERHVYTFDGITGAYINVTLRRESGGLNPILRLYGPDGGEIASDDNSGGDQTAALRNIRLPEAGEYSLAVWGDGFTGVYQIVFRGSEQPFPVTPAVIFQPTPTRQPDVLTPTVGAATSQTLEDHAPVIAQISRPGDFNRYIVYASAGDVFTVGARPAVASALRPQIEVYDPEGALVATAVIGNSEADGGALVSALAAGMDGAYGIFVTGESGSTGAYIIAYGRGVSHEEVRRGEALADQVYNGAALRRGQREAWSLYLEAGDVILAAAGATDFRFSPALELAAPDGSVMAADSNSSGGQDALIEAAHAPMTGLYRLRVMAAGGFDGGAYTLIWRYVERAPTPTPAPGTVLLLSFDDRVPPDTYQFYTFQGQAGQQVQIQVIAQGESFDPVAALVDGEGRVIAEGDDSRDDLNPRFTTTLPADGTYTVRVNGYLSGGDFVVTVEAIYRNP